MSYRGGRQGRGFGAPRVVVRETDGYLERRNAEDEHPEPPNKWIYNLFQPGVVTILIACITWSVAHAIAPLVRPEASGPFSGAAFLWTTSVVMTFVGFRTHRVTRKRFLSGSDALRARIIELALLFVAVKVVHHLDDTVPELLDAMRSWTQSPFTFFDSESVVAFLLGAVGWLAAGLTAGDLDDLVDPVRTSAASANGETDPRHRIVNRYFIGAAILLFFTAMNRVSVRSVLQMTNERVRAPIGNVLLYFLLGILMLGQVHWMRLTANWQREKVRISDDLAPTWLRYALLFVGLAALLAFLLPTGYTVGILDLVTMAVVLVSYLATLLYLLLLWPILMLLALLMGTPPEVEQPRFERPPPFVPPPAVTGAEGNSWWAIARSALFWVTLLVVVVYLVRSYIRDRPWLMDLLHQLAPMRWLGQSWRGIRRWLRALGRRFPSGIPSLLRGVVDRLGLRRAAAGGARRSRIRRLSAREQIIHYYMTTLDRAREWGIGRRQTETPYEYRSTLTPRLEEGQEALNRLTEAFVAARYSTSEFTAEEVEAQAANAAQVQQHLRATESDRQDPPSNQTTGPDRRKSPPNQPPKA